MELYGQLFLEMKMVKENFPCFILVSYLVKRKIKRRTSGSSIKYYLKIVMVPPYYRDIQSCNN